MMQKAIENNITKIFNDIDRNKNEKNILIGIKVKCGMQNGDKICMKRNPLLIFPLNPVIHVVFKNI